MPYTGMNDTEEQPFDAPEGTKGSTSSSAAAAAAAGVPRWKQRPYQAAFLGLVLIAGAGITAGVLVVRSVGNAVVSSNNGRGTDDSSSGNNNNNNNAVIDGDGSLTEPSVPTVSTTTEPSAPPSKKPPKVTTPTEPPFYSFPPTPNPSFSPVTPPPVTALPTITPSLLPTAMPSMPPSTLNSLPPSLSSKPTMTATAFPTSSLRPSQSSAPTVTAMPTTSAPSDSNPPTEEEIDVEPFGFYLMGDTPYAPWEGAVLDEQLANMTATRKPTTHFTVHVGDTQKPIRSSCAPSHYQRMHNRLVNAGPLPTFVVPGDNDWFDCPDPEWGLQLFREKLVDIEDKWYDSVFTALPANVIRFNVSRQEEFPELFTFRHEGILFVSIHLIDTKPDVAIDDNTGEPVMTDALQQWNHRMEVNIAWFWKAMSDYSIDEGTGDARPLKAVVMFGHGQVSPDTLEFFAGIKPAFFTINPRLVTLPILYLHGDGHNWDVDDRIRNQLSWSSFIDVQVDQGAQADPCIVELSPAGVPLVQEHDLQYVFANGMIRIDRQRGRYPVGRDVW